LQIHSENLKLIQSTLDSKVLSWSYNDEGTDNMVYEVNNEWIFKIPRRLEVIDMLRRENEFLNYFSKKSPIEVPVFEYYSEKLVGYKKIDGQRLEYDTFENVDESILRQALMDLSGFLNALHDCNFTSNYKSSYRSFFSVEEFSFLCDEIRKNVFPILSQETRTNVNKFMEKVIMKESNFYLERGMIHGDLCISNIIWNEELQKISGIIDFGEISKNAVIVDFISGNFCDPENDNFLILLLSNYNTNDADFFRKVKLFSFIEKLYWGVKFLEILEIEPNKAKDAINYIEYLFSDQKAFSFI